MTKEERALANVVVFCFLFHEDSVLLITRNVEPGAGLQTIPGGHKQCGETLLQACEREMQEETGLSPLGATFAGIMYTHRIFESTAEYISVYYVANEFSGKLQSSDEGDVCWVPFVHILRGSPEDQAKYHPALLALLPEVIGKRIPFEASMSCHESGRYLYEILSGRR